MSATIFAYVPPLFSSFRDSVDETALCDCALIVQVSRAKRLTNAACFCQYKLVRRSREDQSPWNLSMPVTQSLGPWNNTQKGLPAWRQ